MAEIKVSVSIDTENQKETEALHAFMTALSGTPVEVKKAPVKKVAPVAEVVKEETTRTEAPGATVEGPKADEVENQTLAVTIEDVRKLVSEKAATHREAIKAELTKQGANNVTTLDAAKYADFYEFLKGLE